MPADGTKRRSRFRNGIRHIPFYGQLFINIRPLSVAAKEKREGPLERYGPTHVRFGSKADICSAKRHVRFTPKSGHLQCTRPCLLWAKSGHRQTFIRSPRRRGFAPIAAR
jgi:hypothetical protein